MAALLPGFAQAHLKKLAEGQDAGRCIGAMLLIQGTLTAALVVAGLVARRTGMIADAPGGSVVFFAILGTQAAGRIADVFLKVFLAREWLVAHGGVLLATRVARLAVTALVLAVAPSLPWIAVTFLLEGVLSVLAAGFVLAAAGVQPRAPSRALLTDYWRYARPFLVTTPIAMVQDSIDRVLVGRWAGLTAAGYYHVARGLWEVLSSVMVPPGMLMFTRLSALYATRTDTGDRAARETFVHGLDRLLFVSTPLALTFWALAPVGLELLYGPAFLPATMSSRILVLATFAMNVINPYGYLFLALNEAARLIPINAVRLVAYLAVLALLVPPGSGWLPREAAGAAFARLFVVVFLSPIYFRQTRVLAGIGFYRPAFAYALSLAVGLIVFHATDALLLAALPAAPFTEVPAAVAAIAGYLACLDQFHAPTRAHVLRTAALFSPRQMRDFLRGG
jgi:O-antigen/teichoic acid export membrane protein